MGGSESCWDRQGQWKGDLRPPVGAKTRVLPAENHRSSAKLATSTALPVGSFGNWLAGFPTITDPALKLPSADADSDGYSNLLEYATGGNPSSAGDPAPCLLQPAAEGVFWIRFSRVPGLGMIRYALESSRDMSAPWLEAEGDIEPATEDPASMRLRLPVPLSSSGFFRLNVEQAP